MAVKIIISLVSLYAAHIAGGETGRPNIVFIVGDDIGYDDISLHGSDQIQTPNIDMLGYQGVIIENYYTDCYGTASASALFTGKYSLKLGTQGPSIGAAEDRGVPLSERLLSSHLEDLGYKSHFVGKWKLGNSRRGYLPMKRGFQSFYGMTCSVDYFTYDHLENYNGTDYYGHGLFNNYDAVHGRSGHLTEILTDRAVNIIEEHNSSYPLYLHVAHAAAHIGGALVHLQAPVEDVAANFHIAHSARRLYAGLVTGVDNSVGKIIEALAMKGILNNTLVIFLSDNGAQSIGITRNYGCNLPLRGTKGTPWEGAVRTTAIVWHADIDPKIWKGLFHVTDWFPTILAAAGGSISTHIDGINQWNSIAGDEEPKRVEAIIAADDVNKWGAFRDRDMKIVIGNVPNTCGYYGQELNKLIHKAPDYEENLVKSKTFMVFTEYLNIGIDVSYALEKRDLCNLRKRNSKLNDTALEIRDMCVPTNAKGCLYNITADPEESRDLWDNLPEIADHMVLRFRLYWSGLVGRDPPSFDIRANPSNNSYIWLPWLEDEDPQPVVTTKSSGYPFLLSLRELRYYLDLNNKVMRQDLTEAMNIFSTLYIDSLGLLLNDNEIN